MTQAPKTPSPRERWEKRAEWPLTAMALIFLAGYAWPILDPNLRAPWPAVSAAVAWVAWAAFAVDYVARLALSRDRPRFARTHVLDLAVVILPLLRPLRLLRLVILLTVLSRHAGRSLRGRVVIYVVGSTALVMVVGALAMLDVERGKGGANIETFGDAVWWAFATVTTVGYGDRYPVTPQGRVIAGALMLAGIALLGVITATLASWLIERVREVEEESEAVTRRDVRLLADEVAQLRAELARTTGRTGPETGRPSGRD